MRNKIIYMVLGLLTCLPLMESCVKYDALPFDGKTLPRRSGTVLGMGKTDDWLYFNLRTGEIFNEYKADEDIAEGDQIKRLDWDLAFCGFVMRTNSGTSGSGKGGAIDLGYGEYDKWEKVSQIDPDNQDWVVDDHSVYITYSKKDWREYLRLNHMDFDSNPWFDPNNGPARKLTDGNSLLSQAMTFSGPPPVYSPSFHTYVVRTADGERYFKIQIISWFDANSQLGDKGGRMSYYCDELL